MYWLIYLYGFAVACVIFIDKNDISDPYALFGTALLATLWPIAKARGHYLNNNKGSGEVEW